MDHDLYMFSVLEHKMLLEFCTMSGGWRVYGDKTNVSKGEHRRYFKCTAVKGCTGRRVCISEVGGNLKKEEQLDVHCLNCPRYPRKSEDS